MAAPLPPRTCERIKLLCNVHSDRTVAKLVGISRSTLYLLKRRGFAPLTSERRRRPRPSDFAIQANHMCRDELARHYRTSNRSVGRWKRELRT